MLIFERGIETLLVYSWPKIILVPAHTTVRPNWVPWNTKAVLLVCWLCHSQGIGVLTTVSLLRLTIPPGDPWLLPALRSHFHKDCAPCCSGSCELILSGYHFTSMSEMKYLAESTYKRKFGEKNRRNSGGNHYFRGFSCWLPISIVLGTMGRQNIKIGTPSRVPTHFTAARKQKEQGGTRSQYLIHF